MYSGKLRLFTSGVLYLPQHKNEIQWTLVIQAVSRSRVIGIFKNLERVCKPQEKHK